MSNERLHTPRNVHEQRQQHQRPRLKHSPLMRLVRAFALQPLELKRLPKQTQRLKRLEMHKQHMMQHLQHDGERSRCGVGAE